MSYPEATPLRTAPASRRRAACRMPCARIRAISSSAAPFKSDYESAAGFAKAEAVRETVNHWILTSGHYDAVVDFAAAVADPADPQRLNPAYDSGDNLHPNDAGYQAIAATVKLGDL